MTIKEFDQYKTATLKIFNQLNGLINPYIRCVLSIQKFDPSGKQLGEIRFPNQVTIYLESIEQDYYQSGLSEYINKYDFICTSVVWTLTHELMHSEQLLNLSRYKTDINYSDMIENAVERASYQWTVNNIYRFEPIAGFKSCIRDLSSRCLTKGNNIYKRASIKDLYLGIIRYIIFDNMDISKLIRSEGKYKNILIQFPNAISFWIKYGGVYIAENLTAFANYVSSSISLYDFYDVKCKGFVVDNGEQLELKITLDNQMINPVYFYK